MAKGSPVRAAATPPDQYEVESAAHTIQRAHEHMGNKKLMKHVKKHVAKQAKSTNALAQMLQGPAPTMGSAFGQG